MDCNCPEEGSELGIPSHTALSKSAQAEMLLALLGRTPHSLPGTILALYVRSMDGSRQRLYVGSETTLAEVQAQL